MSPEVVAFVTANSTYIIGGFVLVVMGVLALANSED
jgi:hypothetical protein